jgi:hypothetical protein
VPFQLPPELSRQGDQILAPSTHLPAVAFEPEPNLIEKVDPAAIPDFRPTAIISGPEEYRTGEDPV